MIQYNGDGFISIGRSRRVWVDTDMTVVWEYESMNGVDFVEDGNNVKISVRLDESLIGEKIRICAVVNGVRGECDFEIAGGV